MTFRRRSRADPTAGQAALLTIGPAVLGIAFTSAIAPIGTGSADRPGPPALLDTDLEPIVIEVDAPDSFRIGGRHFRSADAMQVVLGRLAGPGQVAFVRIADDAPFAQADAALRACRAAGFAAVSLLTDRPGGPDPDPGDRPGPGPGAEPSPGT